jgi:hypothetical protein
MAEFDNPDDLLAAAKRAHAEGYRRMDAYSPFPVHGLAEAIGFHRTWLPLMVLIAGIVGAVVGFASQYYVTVIDYPLIVGGRPLNSWPAYIPITFEVTILLAALTAVVGMIALNGLPMPYHPVFNVPRFALASKDRFFLIVFSSDPKYETGAVRRFLEGLSPRSIAEVPN